ncbi:MAG: helix-turn-helix transcriptional regulator [Methylotenera sp.]
MNQLLSNASVSVQPAWQSVAQTGITGLVPAFQPVISAQSFPAIAERKEWLDEEFREAYMEASVEQNIAWQIKFNREKRNLSQKNLAQIIGTQQSAISRIEDPSYGALNLRSIVKIAHAFKCAISIKLISYSDLAEESKGFSKQSLIVKSFEEEITLIKGDKNES